MRGRESLLGQLIRRRLVVADVHEVRVDAELVERTAQKHLVRRDAGQIERAGGHQEHAIGCARQVVLAIATVFEETRSRSCRTVRKATIASRISCTLPQYGKSSVDGISSTPRTRLVATRLRQRVDEAAHGVPVTAEHLTDDIVGCDLRQIAAGTKNQRGRGRHRRSSRRGKEHQHDGGHRDDHCQADERQDQTNTSACSHDDLLEDWSLIVRATGYGLRATGYRLWALGFGASGRWDAWELGVDESWEIISRPCRNQPRALLLVLLVAAYGCAADSESENMGQSNITELIKNDDLAGSGNEAVTDDRSPCTTRAGYMTSPGPITRERSSTARAIGTSRSRSVWAADR